MARTAKRLLRAPCLVLLLALLAACGARKAEPLAPGAPVLVLGDSISAGYGLPPHQAWPALLAERTGWRIANGSVSGDKAADALARLPGLLEAHAPKLVLIQIGGNDMLRRVPEAKTRTDLMRAISLAQARGAVTVLVASPRPSVAGAVFQHLSAASFYAELAKEAKADLIEDAIAEVLSNPELKLDALHPNATGQAALADKAFEALRRFGYAR